MKGRRIVGKVKRLLAILWRTVELVALCVALFAAYLLFRPVHIPGSFVNHLADKFLSETLTIRVSGASFGFIDGLRVFDLGVYKGEANKDSDKLFYTSEILVHPFQRFIRISDLTVPRLHDGYYEEGNSEKNEAIEFELPEISRFSFELINPNVLSVSPCNVVGEISSKGNVFTADRVHIKWTKEKERCFLDGACAVDFSGQRVYGDVRGFVKQHQIRPLLETIDITSSLPYIDAFTEVKGTVPASCEWKVNLVNNDFDMDLDLHPVLGKYNGVPLKKADGKIKLHVYTRGNHLNYSHVFGPITAVGTEGEDLSGTVFVDGSNGWNSVRVEAKSLLPVADLLKIGGFVGEYVGRDVVGDSKCNLLFNFPRAKSDDVAYLNGSGSLSVKNGQLMRLKGFTGLVELLADKLPGFSMLTDSTDASCNYTIENGVLKTNDLYIEGSVFSIKMYGKFDAVNDKLDFTVRVQFMKRDSIAGKVLHSLTWPFTKLLLEYRLTGSSSAPEWQYISVIDRLTGDNGK